MNSTLGNLISKVNAMYRKHPPSNGPIDNIQRYDWKRDPNNYLQESQIAGIIPYGRCHHCGWQYNNYTKFTAFCNVCERALNYMSGGYMSEAYEAQKAMQDSRNRVADGKTRTSVYMQ